RAMETLVVVLDDQLPVGGDVIDDAMAAPEGAHFPGCEAIGKIAELGSKRRRIRGQVEKDVAIPGVSGDAVQRIVLETESGDIVHVRRADQPAVEIVGPRVVRTLDAARERPFRTGAEPCAAMAADVVERANASGRRAG